MDLCIKSNRYLRWRYIIPHTIFVLEKQEVKVAFLFLFVECLFIVSVIALVNININSLWLRFRFNGVSRVCSRAFTLHFDGRVLSHRGSCSMCGLEVLVGEFDAVQHHFICVHIFFSEIYLSR